MPPSSFEFTRNALEAFLRRPVPGIMAVKGKWGVGKTYLWNEVVKSFSAGGGATVAYVSLFGVTSIAELRRMIVARRAPFPKSNTLKRKILTPVTKATTLLRYVDIGVVKHTALLAEAVEDGVLRDIVVCVDDLERKEPSLSEHSLLGFLTSLRDEKNCKVVLLFNEEAASRKGGLGSTLSEYREKVIDSEVSLQPTPKECFDLVFGPSIEKEDLFTGKSIMFLSVDNRSVRGIFSDANIANIRVLRRTNEAFQFFEAKLERRYPLLWPCFSGQIAKLCIFHFVYGNTISLKEASMKDRWIQYYLDAGKAGEESEEAKRFKPIFDLNYHPLETDALIVDYLTSGYVDFEEARGILKKVDDSLRRDTLGAESNRNWNLLWDNFKASGADFIAAQTLFLRANYDNMHVASFSQFVEVAEKIGECAEAQAMLERKISEFAERTRDHDDLGFSLNGVTPIIVERINNLRATAVPHRKPISEVINLMSNSSSWNQRDVRFLAGYAENDFFDWLTSSTDPQLITKLKSFLSRIGDGVIAESVRNNFENALHRLAKRSKADEFRVRNGVGLPQKPKAKV